MNEDFTPEQLAAMTPDERAALKEEFDEDVSRDEIDSGAVKPGSVRDDQDKARSQKFDDEHRDEGQDQDDAEARAAAAEAAKDAAAIAAAQAGQDKGKPDAQGDDAAPGRDDGSDGEDDQKPAPRQQVNPYALPDDYDDQVAAVETAKNAIVDQYNEGDIDQATYQREMDKLGKQERQLERDKDRFEMHAQQVQDNWLNVTVPAFLDSHSIYRKAPAMFTALDHEVRKIQAANPDRQFDAGILTEAHATLRKQLQESGVMAKDDDAGKPAVKPDKPKPVKRPEAPPSLAHVPASDGDDPTQGEFSELDKLQRSDPIAYENQLATMKRTNPAKYDDYMQQ